mgnify:CR=1 FL=1
MLKVEMDTLGMNVAQRRFHSAWPYGLSQSEALTSFLFHVVVLTPGGMIAFMEAAGMYVVTGDDVGSGVA